MALFDPAAISHEVISIVIGGAVTLIWNKAIKVAKDVNHVWPRLRTLEQNQAKIMTQLGIEPEDPAVSGLNPAWKLK